MYLCHQIGVRQDRQGLLEALEILVANQDSRWLTVAGDNYAIVLILNAIYEFREVGLHRR